MQPMSTAAELVDRLSSEGLIGAAAAARKLGTFRAGRPVHPSTISRWASRGQRTPAGQLVRLETVIVAGRLMTSWPAVLRYLAAQQVQREPPGNDQLPSPTARCRAADRAAEVLKAAGA